MSEQATTMKTKTIDIKISRENMKAYLMMTPGTQPEYDDVAGELQSAGITHGIKPRERIEAFLNDPGTYDYCFPIATGKNFTKGDNAEIVYHFGRDARLDVDAGKPALRNRDFSRIGAYTIVGKDDIIAEKRPARQGEDGYSVFGETLRGEWGIETKLHAGAGVHETEDGRFIAQMEGVPSVRGNVLKVDPVHVIEGPLEGENIKFAGTIIIKGDVSGEPHVQASGDVIVEGSVGGACITAGGDLVIKKDARSSGIGLLKAGGSVYARRIDGACVRAGANVLAEEGISQSRVTAEDKVEAAGRGGYIEGGIIAAGAGAKADRIGSANNIKTLVQAGFAPGVHAEMTKKYGEIKALKKTLSEAQNQYRQLASSGGGSTEKEKGLLERISSLMSSIKQNQDAVSDFKKKKKVNPLATVIAETGIYPGAVITLADNMLRIDRFSYGAEIGMCPKTKKVIPKFYDSSGNTVKDTTGDSRSLLIVDDCKDVRRFIRLMAERMGFTVVAEAEDGAQGIELFRKHRPAFVTCDINMVNMNGIDALKLIKAAAPGTKVIMISAIKDKEHIVKCIAAGADDYLKKPITPAAVEGVLKSALHS